MCLAVEELYQGHGATWVKGTDSPTWEGSLNKNHPTANPVMELLHSNKTKSIHSLLKPIVCGNPWLRPQRVLCQTNKIQLYLGGRAVTKLCRSILPPLSNLRQSLFIRETAWSQLNAFFRARFMRALISRPLRQATLTFPEEVTR